MTAFIILNDTLIFAAVEVLPTQLLPTCNSTVFGTLHLSREATIVVSVRHYSRIVVYALPCNDFICWETLHQGASADPTTNMSQSALLANNNT